MNLYHEVEVDKLESIRVNGLTQGSGGDKRDDDIYKTEVFLNRFRSKSLTSKGLDRLNNIYCYLADDDGIIDITSGDYKQPKEIVDGNKYALIQINPRIDGCFVSDLDTYDQVKAALTEGDIGKAHGLAAVYWKRVVPLSGYDGSYRRPEVMLTYDVLPGDITVVEK